MLVVVEPGTVVLVVLVELDVVVVVPGTVVLVVLVVGGAVVDVVVDVVDVDVVDVDVVEVDVVVTGVHPSGWLAVAWVPPVKPSDHVASVANVTDDTPVERTGELNVCEASGASDQLVLEPGGVMVIVPVIVGPGELG